MNPNIPMETFLPPDDFSHVHILPTKDTDGLNNAVLPIRVNQRSLEIISAVVSFQTYRPDFPLTSDNESALDTMFNEEPFRKHILYFPQRWFNAYQASLNNTLLASSQPRRGDLLVHFAGDQNQDSKMRLWLDRAELHLPEWEIDLKNTTYPTETKQFWTERRLDLDAQKKKLLEVVEDAKNLAATTENQLRLFRTQLPEEQVLVIGVVLRDLKGMLDGGKGDLHGIERSVGDLRRVSSVLPLYYSLDKNY